MKQRALLFPMLTQSNKAAMHKFNHTHPLLLAGSLALCSLPAFAVTNTWDGSSSGNWGTPANWNGGFAPVAGATLSFPPGVSRLTTTNNFPANTDFDGFFIGDTYILRGNTVDLTNRIVAVGTGAIKPVIELPLRLTSASSFNLSVSNNVILNLKGAINLNSHRLRIFGEGTTEITGVVSGTGTEDVQNNGPGYLLVESTNTFAGDLLAEGGETRLNGFVTNVTVSGAVFSGSGRMVDLTMAISGDIEPGEGGPGMMTVTGNLALGNIGTLRLDLQGTNVGSNFDHLRVGGPTVNLNSCALDLVVPGSYVPVANTSFMILSNTSASAITGTFRNLPEGAVTNFGGVNFKVSYVAGSGNDVQLSVLSNTNRSWTGSGTTGLWSNPTNWTPQFAPQAGDPLFFTVSAADRAATNDLSLARHGLVSLSVSNYVLNGNLLPLVAGITATHTVGTNTINNPIALLADQTFRCNANGALLKLGAVNLNGNDLVFAGDGDMQAGVLSGSGSVTRSNLGALFLTATNTYTGLTRIVGGDLTLRGGSLSASSFLTVSNAAVRGTGRLPDVALVNSTASIAPGESAGTLTVVGNLLLTNGTAAFEWFGPAPGSQYDQIIVTNGAVTITNCNFSGSAGYIPPVGQAYVLISNDGVDPVVGQFNGLPEGATVTVGSYPYSITYAGGDGNDVVLTALPANLVWTGNGLGSYWGTNGNWNIGSAPRAGDRLCFPLTLPSGKTTMTNDLPALTALGSLNFTNNYTLRGAAIGLTEGFRLVVASVTCQPDVQLFADQSWALTGSLTLNGGLALNARALSVAGRLFSAGSITGTGSLLVTNGGSLAVNGTNLITGTSTFRSATNTVNGRHLGGPLAYENSTLTVAASGVVSNSPITYSNGLFFRVDGLVHSSPVVLRAGTLLGAGQWVNSPLDLQGGEVDFSGSLSDVNASGGRILPGGNSRVILRTGNLTLNPAATLQMDIRGNVPGSTLDQLVVTGAVNLAGATLTLLSGVVLNAGDHCVIIDNDGADAVTGTFAGLPEGAPLTINVAHCHISYHGGDGNDVAIVVDSVDSVGTWAGLDSVNGWSRVTNWVGQLQPGSTDNLVFPDGSGNKTNQFDFNADKAYNSLTFTGSGYDISPDFNNSDNILTITSNLFALNPTGTNTLGTKLDFGSTSCLVSNVPGSTLRLSGALGGSFSVVLPIFSPAGAIELGAIGDTRGGSAVLVKRGPGRLTLNGPTEHSGTEQVEAGTLAAGSQSALGSRFVVSSFFYPTVVVSNSATLDISGAGTFSSKVTLHGRLLASAGNPNWNDTITLAASTAVLETASNVVFTLNGSVAGTNGFTKEGSGTVQFNGAKSYTGGTFVNAGTLFTAGLNTNTAVTVNNGGTLSGFGSLGPLTCFNGTIAPGRQTAAGGLYCDQGVNMNAATTFRLRLFDASGTNHDQLQVVGPVILGNAQLAITQANFVAPVGSSYLILTNDSSDAISGTFAGLPNDGLLTNGSAVYRIAYNGDTGNDVVLKLERYLATGVTRTWAGAGSNGFWTTPQNWSGNVVPTPGDLLAFPAGAAQLSNTNDFATNTVFHSVAFPGSTAGYRLDGNPIALIAQVSSSATSGTNTLGLRLILTTNQVISAAQVGGTLAFAGTVDSNSKTITAGGAGNLLFLGPVVGTGSFEKTGNGAVEFRGTNTYAGATRVFGGRLTCRNSTPGANNGALFSVTNGASLELLGAGSLTKAFVLGSTVTVSNSGTVVWGGSLQFPTNTPTTLTLASNTTLQTQLALDAMPGVLFKDGPGTLHLREFTIPFCCTFPAPHHGATVVNAGRLLVESSIGAITPGYSNIVVNAGSEVLAIGDLPGIVVNSGSFRPSLATNTANRARLLGNLQLSPGARLDLRLNGVVAGTDHDQVGVNGSVILGDATLNVSTGAVVPVLGSQFLIITNDSSDAVIGTFDGLPEGAVFPAGSMYLQVSYTGGDGNDVVLTRVNPPIAIGSITPQPNGAMQVAGTGLLGLPYALEAATNLTPTIFWLPLKTNNADSFGNLLFTDTTATNFPQRFYRLRQATLPP